MVELCDMNDCTGCLACYNICSLKAIDLKKNSEGFIYPKINLSICIECGLCRKTCPIINQNKRSNFSQKVYAFQSLNPVIINNSSSGGFFTHAALNVFSKNGYVYGAAFNKDITEVNHIEINSEKELDLLRRSKYIQSNINNSFSKVKERVKENKFVLFTGTPCQVAGLKSYMGGDFENLVTVDLVCHGVPSPKIFCLYKQWIEQKYKSRIKEYSFRNKKWSWTRFNTYARLKNGKVYIGKWETDPFMRGFLRELFLRPSCHKCLFASPSRISDITIADYWGYKDNKLLRNKDEGISMVIINTEKGQEFYNCLRHSEFKELQTVFSEAIKSNPALSQPFPQSHLREQFWQDVKVMGFEDLRRKYMYPERISNKIKLIYFFGKNSPVLRFLKTVNKLRKR